MPVLNLHSHYIKFGQPPPFALSLLIRAWNSVPTTSYGPFGEGGPCEAGETFL